MAEHRKKYDEAIESLELAIEKDPKNGGAYTNLGNVYNKLNDYKKAAKLHEESIKLAPEGSNAYSNVGTSYKYLGYTKKAIDSYKKSAQAWADGKFNDEIVSVEIPQRKGDPIQFDHDEEYKNVFFDKIPKLRPVFDKEGSVTAANASKISDGAAAMVVAGAESVKSNNYTPMAKIVGHTTFAHEPEWFTTAPVSAIQKLLEKLEDNDDVLNVYHTMA